MDALVSTEWLDSQLGHRNLCVIDASYFLPEHGRDARAEFEAAHIPCAMFLDLAEVADTDSGLPTMLPPIHKFASRLHAAGAGDGCRIILYDNSPLHSSARAWWMLHVFGIPDVLILDGGFAKWKAEGRQVETQPGHPELRHFTPRHAPQRVRSIEEMKAIVEGNRLVESGGDEDSPHSIPPVKGRETKVQIVDARSAQRFAGLEPEARPGVAPGHIPGSCNLHYARFFNPDGTWKRDDALSAVFSEEGIDLSRPVVATCGSGITAAIIVFAAYLLDHEIDLYDGSWAEWGADPDTPKAMGAA